MWGYHVSKQNIFDVAIFTITILIREICKIYRSWKKPPIRYQCILINNHIIIISIYSSLSLSQANVEFLSDSIAMLSLSSLHCLKARNYYYYYYYHRIPLSLDPWIVSSSIKWPLPACDIHVHHYSNCLFVYYYYYRIRWIICSYNVVECYKVMII